MTFSEKLKLAMTERNIKPVELALKIGKNKSSVSQYLSGMFQLRKQQGYYINLNSLLEYHFNKVLHHLDLQLKKKVKKNIHII